MGNSAESTDGRPWFNLERSDRVLRLTAGGSWTVHYAAQVDGGLRRIETSGISTAEIDGREIAALDSTGAWLLVRTKRQLETAGLRLTAFAFPDIYAPLIGVIESESVLKPVAVQTHVTFAAFLDRLGRATHHVMLQTLGILGYLGRVTVDWFKTLYAPQRHFRLTATVHQIEEVGINALPIVGMLMFLVGVVLAYQGADQLKRFGLEVFAVNALGVGILRELGVLITAIIIAGRSGSAFTAQIGTMKVNEETDAMQTMGLNVDDVLILPRVTALVIALPFLVFYADIVALIGGAMMCYFELGITVPVFIRQLQDAVSVSTFLVGIIKAPVFAFVIALVGCYEGFQVERNAASVGSLTTRSVVEGIFLVIVLDAAFSVMFSVLGI